MRNLSDYPITTSTNFFGYSDDFNVEMLTTVFSPERKKISPNILDNIGFTPLVRINRIAHSVGLDCELYAKCLFFNSSSSSRNRMSRRIVEQAEFDNRLNSVSVVIVPISGYEDISLSLATAMKGYRTIIILPEIVQDKVDVLKAIGVEIIYTSSHVPNNSPDSHLGVAERLCREIPNSVSLENYLRTFKTIPFETTAEEILQALDGRIDMLVIDSDPYTIITLGKRLKEKCPSIKVVAVEPSDTPNSPTESTDSITFTFLKKNADEDILQQINEQNLVDAWFKSEDNESFLMTRRLFRDEGLLCGKSSGTAMSVALKVATSLKRGQRCVVILPDSFRNQSSSFTNDDWLLSSRFAQEAFQPGQESITNRVKGSTVADLQLNPVVTIDINTPCRMAISIMEKNAFDQLPVVDGPLNVMVGIITMSNILSRLASARAHPTSPVSSVMAVLKPDIYRHIHPSTPLGTLTKFFEAHSCALITDPLIPMRVLHVATKVDLLAFLVKDNSTNQEVSKHNWLLSM